MAVSYAGVSTVSSEVMVCIAISLDPNERGALVSIFYPPRNLNYYAILRKISLYYSDRGHSDTGVISK
jgi:hypothetical protein